MVNNENSSFLAILLSSGRLQVIKKLSRCSAPSGEFLLLCAAKQLPARCAFQFKTVLSRSLNAINCFPNKYFWTQKYF